MEKKEITRQDIIQALKELHAEGKQPSIKALAQKGINGYWIHKQIPEGLTELKQQLDLKITSQERPLSDDKLLEELDKIVSKLERIPTWAQIRRETGITDKVFRQRFGNEGIHEVFSHYRKWLEKHQPMSKNINLVDTYLEPQVPPKSPQSPEVKGNAKGTMIKGVKLPGRKYGSPINFGNLIYEPVNEQGVVFLFGMVSKALGFSIEYVGPDFPDCEAKRYIEGRQGRQQPVRIEFEYKSRDFNHVEEDCDIIVCWEDNWGDACPLEVIELRTVIKKLRELPEFSRI
jgi:hypothetical protein